MQAIMADWTCGGLAENVSIPYSSGEKCKFECESHIRRLFLLKVSIPYSSGEKCKIGLCKSFIFKGLQRQKL